MSETEKDILVLVVDDSVTDRQIISKIVSGFDNVELVGTARNGAIALTKIDYNPPDLVLLDMFMPEMDGLETLEEIKKQHPHIDVIIISGIDKETANMTVRALEMGALDFVTKPRGMTQAESEKELRMALGRLIPIARTRKYARQIKGISRAENRKPPEKRLLIKTDPPSSGAKEIIAGEKKEIKEKDAKDVQPFIRVRKTSRIDAVAIGVSTGGPNALQEVIPKLPETFSVPIFAVQHMPVMFTASLAQRLNNLSRIRVMEGADQQKVEAGMMYIAPGGRHMVVRSDKKGNKILGLVDSPPVNSCRPSVDVLFRSVAMVYGGNVLTVIMTGMGNDGISGVAAIRRKGGYSIVQDEKSSVIWGMPGAVVEAGEVDAIIRLDVLADKISEIVSRGRL